MTDEVKPKIKLFSRFARTPQWGKSFVFQKSGLKSVIDKKWFKITSLILFLLAVVLSFYKKEKMAIVYKNSVNLPAEFKTDKPLSFSGLSDLVTGNTALQKEKRARDQKLKAQINYAKSLGPQIVRPKDSIVIPVGTFAPAILVTGASNGPVKAKLTQSININGETLIDEGSILFGQGLSTDERLFITFTKIITSDGTNIKIVGHAYEGSDQIVGLKGSRVGQRALEITGGIGLGFLGGMSEGLESSQTVNGTEVKDNSLRNAMLNGAAHSSIDESKELLNDLRAKKVILEVPANTNFTVLFDELPNEREK